MVQNLDEWFCRYKCTSSNPEERPALGRRDPFTNMPLFTMETKAAVDNCKEKAVFLADPLPLEEMYDTIPPNPNSKHQLPEFLSCRGESKLEPAHDRMSNFANSGMRDSLADNLNLMGTARYNLVIRHKHSLIQLAATDNNSRTKVQSVWEKVSPYYNHSELMYVNGLAEKSNMKIPFPTAERLGKDTGERFFSEYMTMVRPGKAVYCKIGHCLCDVCKSRGRSQDSFLVAPAVHPKRVVVAEITAAPNSCTYNRQ